MLRCLQTQTDSYFKRGLKVVWRYEQEEQEVSSQFRYIPDACLRVRYSPVSDSNTGIILPGECRLTDLLLMNLCDIGHTHRHWRHLTVVKIVNRDAPEVCSLHFYQFCHDVMHKCIEKVIDIKL